MSGTASLRRQAEREERARQRLEKEKARTEAMSVYERRFADRGLIAGIDEVERAAAPLGGGIEPVACDAGGIFDDGETLSDQLVKEHGFSDIRSPDDGNKRS